MMRKKTVRLEKRDLLLLSMAKIGSLMCGIDRDSIGKLVSHGSPLVFMGYFKQLQDDSRLVCLKNEAQVVIHVI